MVMLTLMVLTLGSCSKNPIQKEVDELNKELPQVIDQGITLTKVEYDESSDAIKYFYDIEASTYEAIDNPASKDVMKQVMARELASEPEVMGLNVKRFTFVFRNEDSGESFTSSVTKAEMNNLSAEAEEPATEGDEAVQSQIDALQSQLPMQTGEGVEWTAASYDPAIGQVTFSYTISNDIYSAINSSASARELYENEVVKGFKDTPGLKELNVQSYSLQFNTTSGKNFGFTKTWSEIFE